MIALHPSSRCEFSRRYPFTSRSAEPGRTYGVTRQQHRQAGQAFSVVMTIPTLQNASKRGNPARQMVGTADYLANQGDNA